MNTSSDLIDKITPRIGPKAVPVFILATLAAMALSAHAESAPEPDSSQIFATRGEAVLTQGELDATLARIPDDLRTAFVRDGARMDDMVGELLLRKLIAADARSHGFDADPVAADRVRLAAEKELAQAWLEKLEATAPETDFEALAREDYLANPEKYARPETFDLSQILVNREDRSDDEAQALAGQIVEKLAAEPGQFGALVVEYSDDPYKTENGGSYTNLQRGQLVEQVEDVLLALEPGAIGGPVLSQYGYHIVRLDGRRPAGTPSFEEVREEAIENARAQYRATQRRVYLDSLRTDPIEVTPGAVEILVGKYLGDDVELGVTE